MTLVLYWNNSQQNLPCCKKPSIAETKWNFSNHLNHNLHLPFLCGKDLLSAEAKLSANEKINCIRTIVYSFTWKYNKHFWAQHNLINSKSYLTNIILHTKLTMKESKENLCENWVNLRLTSLNAVVCFGWPRPFNATIFVRPCCCKQMIFKILILKKNWVNIKLLKMISKIIKTSLSTCDIFRKSFS